MKVTRATALVLLTLYVFLWVLALNGASSLEGPLAVPLILAVLVAVLVWFQRFMGFSPKSPKFNEPPTSDQKDIKDPE
jgi:fatty acid desaturase